MSKYPCRLIEDLIPLYVEGDVSDETKEIVEEHLRECYNCKALVKKYSNDELELSNFPENIPQANTFKKWMKSLKIWASIITIAILIAIIAIGGLGYKIGEKSKNDLLTLKTIVKTFQKEGVHLEKDNSNSYNTFKLKGIKPAVFSIGKTEDKLLIYTFKSFVEREDIVKETDKFNNPFSKVEVPYNAKNAFIVYMTSKLPESEADMKNVYETENSISNIIFKYLNDGKEIIYKGESTHWEGIVTLKYYEHWWEDENGKFYYESYNTQYPVIRYKISDIKNVGPIDLKYETTTGGGSSTGLWLDNKGYANIGTSSGNGAIPRENDTFNVTVKWNGKEESLILAHQ